MFFYFYFRGFILPLYFPNGGKLNHNNYKKVTLQNIFNNKKMTAVSTTAKNQFALYVVIVTVPSHVA